VLNNRQTEGLDQQKVWRTRWEAGGKLVQLKVASIRGGRHDVVRARAVRMVVVEVISTTNQKRTGRLTAAADQDYAQPTWFLAGWICNHDRHCTVSLTRSRDFWENATVAVAGT
jgi:hypothetical protein